MKTILITGATGFLGSHIVEELIKQKFTVIALKRSTSDTWRCDSFKDKIKWINCDESAAEKKILECKPEIFIHTAWNGTCVADRENWKMQEKNLTFLIKLLEIVKKTKITKIIALGSQAEYGYYEGIVSEDHLCDPTIAYGVVKVCASSMIKIFAQQNNIDWYWIRLFSVFGPREQNIKLIPVAINNLSEKKIMKLSLSEQRGDYLFTADFASGILNIVKSNNITSGMFNFSNGKSIKIKDILLILEDKLSPHENLLQFGALSYRSDQIMHMEGNSDRFFKSFNFQPSHNIYESLDETIRYYLNT